MASAPRTARLRMASTAVSTEDNRWCTNRPGSWRWSTMTAAPPSQRTPVMGAPEGADDGSVSVTGIDTGTSEEAREAPTGPNLAVSQGETGDRAISVRDASRSRAAAGRPGPPGDTP